MELNVTYGATVDSTNFGEIISENLVTFNVYNLEDNPVWFMVDLNSCETNGSSFHPVENIEYNDDQGNSPNFTAMLDTTIETCSEGI